MGKVRDMPPQQALAILGAPPPDLQGVTDQQVATARLKAWKVEVLKPRYIALCREHHPDLGSTEEQEERTARMGQITAAYAALKDVQIQPNRPQIPAGAMVIIINGRPVIVQPGQTVVVNMGGGTSSASTSGAYTNTTTTNRW